MDMTIAHTIDELQSFLNQTLQVSNFSIKEVALDSQKEWLVNKGVLSHKAGGFFHVVGYSEPESQNEHLVLFQPQGAYVGILICRVKGTPYILLQARVEPGNTGIAQYGPTIQSTPANYQRVHGGKTTSYLDYFIGYRPDAKPIFNASHLDLGERYYQKTKTLGFVEVPELLATDKNSIWVSLDVVKEGLLFSNFFNADLRSMFTVFDWHGFMHNSVLKEPKTSSEYGRLFRKKAHWHYGGSLVPISSLKNWELSNRGVEDHCGSGLSVRMYKISCINREVATWCQPLMCSENQGLSILVIRKKQQTTEVLIKSSLEFGISGFYVALPTYLSYDDQGVPDRFLSCKLVNEMIQCEEGGRFMQNQSLNKLMLANESFELQENEIWLSITEFKNLMRSSNVVSIQLRSIASLIPSILDY